MSRYLRAPGSYLETIERAKFLALDNPSSTFWVLPDMQILTDEEMDIEAGINFPHSTPVAVSVAFYPEDGDYEACYELEEWEIPNVQTI